MSEREVNESAETRVEKEELFEDIAAAIHEIRKDLDIHTLSYVKPERAANVLYRWSIGWSQTRIKREMGVQPAVLRTLLVDYADKLGKWQEMGARIASRSYVRMSLLEDNVMERLEESVLDPEREVTFNDLKSLSIAKTNSHREASLARGQATSITEERKVVTQEDYEETLRKAQERLSLREGSIDLEDEDDE